jgi:hypothetical protein
MLFSFCRFLRSTALFQNLCHRVCAFLILFNFFEDNGWRWASISGSSFPARAQIPSFSPFHWPSPTLSLSLAMSSNTYPIFHARFSGDSDFWLELELELELWLRFWYRSWWWLWFDNANLILCRSISVHFLHWYSITFIDIHGISFIFLEINWNLLLCIGIQEILSMFIHG